MFIDIEKDTQTLAIAQYLSDELNRLGDEAFDAAQKPRQTVVAKILDHRPTLIKEQFPLLACYRLDWQGGRQQMEVRWHMQISTAIIPDQERFVSWVMRHLIHLIPEYEGQNPCIQSIELGAVRPGYVGLDGVPGTYPTVEAQFSYQDLHA